MNAPFSPAARPEPPNPAIDLAKEAAFGLGRWRVEPSRLAVMTAAGTRRLEPRVMKVLVSLSRRANETVGRDELIADCWDGRVVGEDAIQRCIGRLRKLVEEDPASGVALETIPRVGYRLSVDKANSAPAGSGATAMAQMGLAIVSTLATTAVLLAMSPANWRLADAEPLTAEPGVETQPAIAPGGAVAFVKGQEGENQDLWMRSGAASTWRPVAQSPADEHSPAWSPDGRNLAFVRTRVGGPCEILVADGALRSRQVARCRTLARTRIAWTADGGDLIIVDRMAAGGPLVLFKVDISTGDSAPITRPASSVIGDAEPTPGFTGRTVAFRRIASHGVEDVWTVDLKTGRETRLTRDGVKIGGLAWAPDSRTLLVSSSRSGVYDLWAVGLDGAYRQIEGADQGIGRLSSNPNGALVFERDHDRINLVTVEGGRATPLAPSNAQDWSPAFSPDGTRIAFLSTRGGGADVWLAEMNGAPARRLTRVKAAFARGLIWESDDVLAFTAVRRGRTAAYRVTGVNDPPRTRTVPAADGAVARRQADEVSQGGHAFRIERSGRLPRLVRGGGPDQVALSEPMDIPSRSGLAVHPDGRRVVVARRISEETDLAIGHLTRRRDAF